MPSARSTSGSCLRCWIWASPRRRPSWPSLRQATSASRRALGPVTDLLCCAPVQDVTLLLKPWLGPSHNKSRLLVTETWKVACWASWQACGWLRLNGAVQVATEWLFSVPDTVLEKHLASDPNTPTGEVGEDKKEEARVLLPRRVALQVCTRSKLCDRQPIQVRQRPSDLESSTICFQRYCFSRVHPAVEPCITLCCQVVLPAAHSAVQGLVHRLADQTRCFSVVPNSRTLDKTQQSHSYPLFAHSLASPCCSSSIGRKLCMT